MEKPSIILHPKYMPIATSDSRYYIVTGGRGSGKSYSITTLLTMLTCEAGHTILFTRYTMVSALISIIPEFLDKIETMGLQDQFTVTKNEIVNNSTDSKILFRGIKTSSGDQSANLKSLQGITTWIIEEAEELMDENVFDRIDLSVRQKGMQNRVIIAMNPTTKKHWIYERFFLKNGVNGGENITKNNVTYIHTTYFDNEEHLSGSFIAAMEDMKVKRPVKYANEVMGGWLDKATGVVYNNWSVGEFNPNHLQVIYGQDYGFTNDPTTLVAVAIDKKKKIIYAQEHMYDRGISTSDTAKINMSVCAKRLIVSDSAEPRMISEMQKLGCNVIPCKKGPGSVSAGIALIQDYDLVIHPDSENLAMELNNYAYSHKDSGTILKKNDHLLDALRYAVSNQLMGGGKISIR